jgi:hypothetical protein
MIIFAVAIVPLLRINWQDGFLARVHTAKAAYTNCVTTTEVLGDIAAAWRQIQTEALAPADEITREPGQRVQKRQLGRMPLVATVE